MFAVPVPGGLTFIDTFNNISNIMPPFALQTQDLPLNDYLCKEKFPKIYQSCLNLYRFKINSIIEVTFVDGKRKFRFLWKSFKKILNQNTSVKYPTFKCFSSWRLYDPSDAYSWTQNDSFKTRKQNRIQRYELYPNELHSQEKSGSR